MLKSILAASLALTMVTMIGASAAFAGCQGEGQLHSEQYSIRTHMKFINSSGSTKRIYWINYQGMRQLYSTLSPGRTYRVDTFVTHPWVVTQISGACYGLYLPNKFSQTINLN
ncbi:hypothetical protein [Aestuariivirga litoralis]|uniref:VHL beta domain-containing protein n=1 Tax=Aestuariivirga litoralis TaxID=2650924 RepID=UPI0018C4A9FF|nr:hypothetical protein [Aestuariivirga litoralis]MBG1231751.1 hypothetical protein [Aestuariivirga litoralis]